MKKLAVLCLLGSAAGASLAHPLAPALLQLQERDAGTYSMFWRTSVARTPDGDVMPVLPQDCVATGQPDIRVGGSSFEQRSLIRCQGGIAGKVLSVSNLESTGINIVIRIETRDGVVLNGLLDAAQPQYVVPLQGSDAETVGDYFRLGGEHLLQGLDHLLFITGLVLLVSGWRRLVGTVTAFTLGHSLTLGVAVLGYADINPSLVEVGIALSLLVLACELARPDPGAWVRRRPWEMAGLFGLLHGFGFAGALASAGVPANAIPEALLGFNLGIEAGQLAVVAALLLVGAMVRPVLERRPVPGRGPVARRLAVYAMGSLAGFWVIERLAAVVA